MGTVPHTSTSYDDNIRGLSVAWWENRNLVSPATTYSTGFRQEDTDQRLATNFGAQVQRHTQLLPSELSFRMVRPAAASRELFKLDGRVAVQHEDIGLQQAGAVINFHPA